MIILLSSPLAGQTKKYDIKSGIITFENTTIMGKLKHSIKTVVYFDNYGMLECKETYHENKLVESFFSDGETLFSLKHEKKKAYKRGSAYRGTEYRFDWAEVSQNDKKDYKAKRLPNIIVAGKDCESFEVTSGSDVTVFTGWDHICFLMDVKNSNLEVILKAMKIEENAKIPEGKFKVPAGYSIE